jgi:hypothetical protein
MIESGASEIYRSLGRPGNFGPIELPSYGGSLDSAISQLKNNINQNDVSTDGLYIEQSFSTPSIGYNHFAEMREGMLAFAVRANTGDPGSTFIITLHQLNGLMREQWDDFVISTTPQPNPRFDDEAKQFLDYLQEFGEQGLGRYEELYSNGAAPKLQDLPPGLSKFWSLAKSDRYCYLTLFGIRQRVNYLGPIVNMTGSYTLDPMDNRGRGQGAVVVGLGARVPCSQIFGRRDDITHQVKLKLTCTRMECEDGGYGAFCVVPGFETQRAFNVTFRDESGAICQAFVRHVGTVHTPAAKESGAFAMLQAANMAPAISNEVAWNSHCALPMFFINAGLL